MGKQQSTPQRRLPTEPEKFERLTAQRKAAIMKWANEFMRGGTHARGVHVCVPTLGVRALSLYRPRQSR